MNQELEIRVVFCRFGLGNEANVVERPVFTSIGDAVGWLESKEVVR